MLEPYQESRYKSLAKKSKIPLKLTVPTDTLTRLDITGSVCVSVAKNPRMKHLAERAYLSHVTQLYEESKRDKAMWKVPSGIDLCRLSHCFGLVNTPTVKVKSGRKIKPSEADIHEFFGKKAPKSEVFEEQKETRINEFIDDIGDDILVRKGEKEVSLEINIDDEKEKENGKDEGEDEFTKRAKKIQEMRRLAKKAKKGMKISSQGVVMVGKTKIEQKGLFLDKEPSQLDNSGKRRTIEDIIEKDDTPFAVKLADRIAKGDEEDKQVYRQRWKTGEKDIEHKTMEVEAPKLQFFTNEEEESEASFFE
eukprot:gnl/Carplike_NY0171/4407_a5981_291.p1 GENE.gnl/Carplike_NY0171/4407_a5981_291~~gnl/Carplike_NY0171/4407_a5981_291.p1  ORF type:complete len:338 (+),score=99.37 gnl/Carplike_NY0171/4407_a5981_291:95-1015(+)